MAESGRILCPVSASIAGLLLGKDAGQSLALVAERLESRSCRSGQTLSRAAHMGGYRDRLP